MNDSGVTNDQKQLSTAQLTNTLHNKTLVYRPNNRLTTDFILMHIYWACDDISIWLPWYWQLHHNNQYNNIAY